MDTDDEGKVFIYGISELTHEEKLKKYFSKYGEILQASVVNDEKGIPRDFGFVVFANPSVVGNVLQDSHIIDYTRVVARKPMSREEQRVARDHRTGAAGRNCGGGENDRTKKIIVGGLPPTLSEGEFSHYFEYYGHVTDVEILCDQQMGRPRGFGVISFNSEYVVDRVLHKKYHGLGGKQVEVIRAPPEMGGGVSIPSIRGHQ